MKTSHKIFLNCALCPSLILPGLHFCCSSYLAVESRALAAIDSSFDRALSSIGYSRQSTESIETSPKILAERAAAQHSINSTLIRAVIKVESNENPLAVSRAGAIGLMQLMPKTAAAYNVRGQALFNPESNVYAGSAHLASLLRKHSYRLNPALQEYNGGRDCIDRCKESINYARSVEKTMIAMAD